MAEQVACTECGVPILSATALRTGGVCMPCKQGTRKSVDEAKQRQRERQATLERLMADPRLRPWLTAAAPKTTKPPPLEAIQPSILTFVPLQGPLPFRFGMMPAEVESLARAVPRKDLSHDLQGLSDTFGNLRVGYTLDLVAEEYSVWPDSKLTVIFNGEAILGPAATTSPLAAFLRADASPREHLGYVIFQALGVAVTGYHHDDPGQRAISFGARHVWDGFYAQAKPIDLSSV